MKQLPSSGYDFPRISISGALILSLNLIVTLILFHSSSYGRIFLGSGNPATVADITRLPNTWVFLTSLLNVLSHSAVVLGALHDTFVSSILIGVGFDVLTRGLHLYWWLQLVHMVHEIRSAEIRKHKSLPIDTVFLGVLSLLFLYQVYVHIRALLLVNSDCLERMQTVLKGALNNLRGIPGDSWKDHLFAYSDLSLHLLPCWLSALLLHQQEKLYSIIPMLMMMTGIFALAPLQTWQLQQRGCYGRTEEKATSSKPVAN